MPPLPIKNKSILILGSIFAILVLGILLQKWHKPRELVTEEYSSLGFTLNLDAIEKIQIGKGDQTGVTLTLKNGIWRIPEAWDSRANQLKVKTLLETVSYLKGELRAQDQSLWSEFGLAPSEAYSVTFSDAFGNVLFKLWVGTQLNLEGFAFVREDQSNQIYVTDEKLSTSVGIFGNHEPPKPEDWMALDIFDFHIDDISVLEIKKRFEGELLTTTAIQKKNAWKYIYREVPFEIDSTKVEDFLSKLLMVQALKVLGPSQPENMKKSVWEMTLQFKAGDTIFLQIADEDESSGGRRLHLSTEPVEFLISDYYFKEMDIDDSEFFADNPLQVTSDEVEKLVIKVKRKKYQFYPLQEPTESFAQFMQALESFKIEHLLINPEEQKKIKDRGPYYLEIYSQNREPVILDVGHPIASDRSEYAARLRNQVQPFSISEATFKTLFENISRLSD